MLEKILGSFEMAISMKNEYFWMKLLSQQIFQK